MRSRLVARRTVVLSLLFLLLALAPGASAWADTLLVPEEYATIQAAVDAAVSDDVVSILPGLYRESVIVSTDGITIESRNQEASTETTIVTGEDAPGAPDPHTHRNFVFKFAAGTGPTTEIRYLTITGAEGSAAGSAGIVVESGSSVSINHSRFIDNHTGGIGSPTAGGVLCSGSPAITHNYFFSNSAYFGGGAVYVGENQTVVIEHNTMDANEASYNASGVYCANGSHVQIRYNSITNGSSWSNCGGAILVGYVTPSGAECSISNNFIAGNRIGSGSSGYGAGVCVYSGTANIYNNIFAHNEATRFSASPARGGGIAVLGGAAAIINNTLHGNSALTGSGIYVDSAVLVQATILNNIVDSGVGGAGLHFDKVVTADYNNTWDNPANYGGLASEGPKDIHYNPRYLEIDNPQVDTDFALRGTSPCIDAGTGTGAPGDDYFGALRPYDGDGDLFPDYDIGACEVLPGLHYTTDTIALYDPATGRLYPRNSNSPGPADITYRFGPPASTWLPVAGDWGYHDEVNGDWDDYDGRDSVGLYWQLLAKFHLRYKNASGAADLTFPFGPAPNNWTSIAGDWDGNGVRSVDLDHVDTIGLYNSATSTFYLRNSNTPGPADLTFRYGVGGKGWIPIVGDWDGDGDSTIGLYDPTNGLFRLRNSNSPGSADITFRYGPAPVTSPPWFPIAGDWNADGVDTIGLYNQSTGTWYLRNSNSPGPADITFRYGPAPCTWLPLAGDWDGF